MEYHGEAPQPYLVITEQPQSRALRFRYQCENRGFTAGSILGVNSTNERRTFPTVEVCGYSGPAKIIVSCVTTDEIPRLHPHRLVGRSTCHGGVCELRVSPETLMACSIANLGIQCIRRRDVDRELSTRADHYSNPFGAATEDSSTINLNAIRLCFELYIEHTPGQYVPVHPPILSETIYDKKSNPELVICALSDCTAPASGGKRIILLTEKINKDDVRVQFFHDRGPFQKPWIAYGNFQPTQHVHKQVAIVVQTPAYDDPYIQHPVLVKIQLQRVKNAETSDALDFELHPSSEAKCLKRTLPCEEPLRDEHFEAVPGAADPGPEYPRLPPFYEIRSPQELHDYGDNGVLPTWSLEIARSVSDYNGVGSEFLPGDPMNML